MQKLTFVFMNMDFCNDDTNLTLTLNDPHDACETVFGESGILSILAISVIRVSVIRADPSDSTSQLSSSMQYNTRSWFSTLTESLVVM